MAALRPSNQRLLLKDVPLMLMKLRHFLLCKISENTLLQGNTVPTAAQ
jgi:hypothetical protein